MSIDFVLYRSAVLLYIYMVSYHLGGSSNGRTADSESANLGSNPSPPANTLQHFLTASISII